MKVCPYCGAPFAPRTARQKLCGKRECRLQYKRDDMAERERRYMAEHGVSYFDRYKAEQVCVDCCEVFRTQPSHGSERCLPCQRQHFQAVGARASADKKLAAKAARLLPVPAGTLRRAETLVFRLAAARLAKAAEGARSKRAIFACGNCARCQKPFVCLWTNDLPRYCSPRCGRAANRDVRRARHNSAEHEPFAPAEIFERDKWRCQIPGCGRSVRRDKAVPHPLAPTIDHIVPVSEGGGHVRANVRCAHFICNATRGNRGGNDQLLLIG